MTSTHGGCRCLVLFTTIGFLIVVSLSYTQGACTFKKSWIGRWFQNGIQNLVYINATHIETKGECYEEKSDKYLVYDKTEDCYKCMAIHEKHPTVLQYKETFCESKSSMQEICNSMTGDALLYSMFRKYPESKPIACPFKSAPFTFTYNRGSGDCHNPPSKAESCTDDSRLVLKYQACPDIPDAESSVEELTCMATWKEGSTKYLIGKVSQVNRRNLINDEDQYRCFIYQRDREKDKTIYSIAQSPDASCTGVTSAFEGSKTMRFTTVDNHHNRCKFPKWITDHHTWVSLDHRKMYKFTQKNATLRILDEDNPKPQKKVTQQIFPQPFAFQEFGFESQDQRRQNSELRVMCHGILESQEQKKVQITAHITAGCNSGYVCMVFYKRDTNVIELQQTEDYMDNPDEACASFDPITSPYTTLITTILHPKKCPHLGRYTVPDVKPVEKTVGGRRRRQQTENSDTQLTTTDCIANDFKALAIGCGGPHEMELKSSCAHKSVTEYSCHGNWHENGVYYVITSPAEKKMDDLPPRPNDRILRYCFIYTMTQQPIIEGVLGKNSVAPTMSLSSVSESCHRHIKPGLTGNWAYNFTHNGACVENGNTGASSVLMPALLLILSTAFAALVLR